MNKKALIAAAGFLLSGVALYFAFRNTDFSRVAQDMHRIQWIWIVLALPIFVACLVIRAHRWKYFIEKNTSPIRNRYNALNIGFFTTNVLPLRIGEIVRAVVLAQRMGRSKMEILATVFSERLFDVIAILVVVTGALPFVPFETIAAEDKAGITLLNFSRTQLVIGSVAVIAAVLGGFLTLCYRGRVISTWALRAFKIDKPFITNLCDSVFSGLEGPVRNRTLVPIMGWSLITWLVISSIYYVALFAFPVGDSSLSGVMGFSGTVFLQGVICAGLLLPAAPGGLGVWQFAALIAIMPYHTVHPDVEPMAFTFTIVFYLATYACTIIVGLESLINEGVSWKDIRAAGNDR